MNVWIVTLSIATLLVGLAALRFLWSWGRTQSRLTRGRAHQDRVQPGRLGTVRQSPTAGTPESVAGDLASTGGLVRRWLFRSGFRGPRVFRGFLIANVAAALLATLVAVLFYFSSVIELGESILRALPGAVGEVFLPLLWISPLLAVSLLVALPYVLVRSRRRARVRMIEQDLPLALDLLATLAEAGLSFDAALQRVLETQRNERPLAEEFRLFRLEILTGRGRVDALRRLKDNINVPWFSIFVSSLIHAEQIGASLAVTLRAQADDLRNRRRERALAQAMGVPVKLLFPLIICFLPGIMIAALGPILFQIIRMLDQFLQNGIGAV